MRPRRCRNSHALRTTCRVQLTVSTRDRTRTSTLTIAYQPICLTPAGANLAWQHVQHQESLPDARARSHDLRNLRQVPCALSIS